MDMIDDITLTNAIMAYHSSLFGWHSIYFRELFGMDEFKKLMVDKGIIIDYNFGIEEITDGAAAAKFKMEWG